jgi:fructose-bisphosphate aldolase, class I
VSALGSIGPVQPLLRTDRKTLIVAIDHGFVFGNIAGLEDPGTVLGRLIAHGVDGTLVSPGLAAIHGGRCRAAAFPYALTTDFQLWGNRPGTASGIVSASSLCSIRRAKDLGASAAKLLFMWGLDDRIVADNIAIAAAAIEEAHTVGLPVMLEPLWFGAPLVPEELDEVIVHGARIAVELGADILKVPAVSPEAVEAMAVWGRPIVLLGGAKQDDPSALIAQISAGLKAGASGVVIGRNVWQHPDMASVIEAIQAAL